MYLYHVWAHHTENCLRTQNGVSTCRVLSTATCIHMKRTKGEPSAQLKLSMPDYTTFRFRHTYHFNTTSRPMKVHINIGKEYSNIYSDPSHKKRMLTTLKSHEASAY